MASWCSHPSRCCRSDTTNLKTVPPQRGARPTSFDTRPSTARKGPAQKCSIATQETAGTDRPYGGRTRVGPWSPRFHLASTTRKSIARRPASLTRTSSRHHPTSRPTSWLTAWSFNPIGLRAAVELCGVDRGVVGSGGDPIPYGIKEHVQIVEDMCSSPAGRRQVFWRTSNRVFRLGPGRSDLSTPLFHQFRR